MPSLQDKQLSKLNSLVQEIYPTNKFYAPTLEQANATTGFDSLTTFSQKFPFTTKPQLAADFADHPPYGSKLTYPLDQYTRFHQTTGTSGAPLPCLDTSADWDWITDNWKTVWTKCGAKAGDVALFTFSFGPFLGFWAAFDSASQLGIRCIPSGAQSSQDRLSMILKHKPTWLCCTPTYALRLAEVAAQEDIDMNGHSIRNIIVAGEPGGSIPEVRQRMEAAWPNAKIHDHHGMTEVGPVTYSDIDNPDLLLINHESYYAEVIDPKTGTLIEEGQSGELVLTTLGRAGSPLLRYRTGDLVKPVPVPNQDPAAFALKGGILGRADDMVIVRGVNLYPSAMDSVLKSFNEIGEYQVIINKETAMTQATLKAENISTTPDQTLKENLEKKLHQVFSLRIPIEILPENTLPRFEMKAKRWTTIS